MANGKNNHDNKKSWGQRIFYGILIIVLATLLFFVPDILYLIRTLLHPNELDGITAKEYVEMMLIIIETCSTGILSFIAYHLSKSLGRITINERKAKITLWATRVEREIKSNSSIIWNKYLNLGADLDELYVLDSSLADIINLSTEQKITLEEQMLLQNCENRIQNIKKKHQKGENVTKNLEEYVQKFLDTSDSPQFKFESTKVEVLMEKLKGYSKGED